MSKWRKKPIVVEAVQYNKYGDHPEVEYFTCIEANSGESCDYCGENLGVHGWIDTLEGGHIVCKGDWIITGVNGEFYPIKEEIFLKTYEQEFGSETQSESLGNVDWQANKKQQEECHNSFGKGFRLGRFNGFELAVHAITKFANELEKTDADTKLIVK